MKAWYARKEREGGEEGVAKSSAVRSPILLIDEREGGTGGRYDRAGRWVWARRGRRRRQNREVACTENSAKAGRRSFYRRRQLPVTL